MQPADMLAADTLDMILQLFGLSIVLNFVLLSALIFRPFYRRLLDQVQTIKIGIQMALEQNDHSSQRS